MRITIVTDAWAPQTNGVVRTLSALTSELASLEHQPCMVTPAEYPTLPLPSYPEVRLALASARTIGRRIDEARPDSIHIATEGPLGFAARRHCLDHGLAFTTSFHTKFPDYIKARLGVPRAWTYAALRRFHEPAAGTMVATRSIFQELSEQGFSHLSQWTRGVDLDRFRPVQRGSADWPRPVFLSVGRLAVEKNLPAFLDLDLPGTKLVVGDGPQRAALERRYPEVRFLGQREGEELASIYAQADVFVFPSRTDTFGLVLLEAMASGVPIAAYPVAGPLDLIDDSGAGVLEEDLRAACLAALEIEPQACRARAAEFTWRSSTLQFLDNLHPVR